MTSLLLCEIDAGNPPATVYWLHITYNNTTGAQIITEITADWNPRFTIVQNGLQISDVRVTDEGVYRCYVQNNRGQDVLDIRASFVGKIIFDREKLFAFFVLCVSKWK